MMSGAEGRKGGGKERIEACRSSRYFCTMISRERERER